MIDFFEEEVGVVGQRGGDVGRGDKVKDKVLVFNKSIKGKRGNKRL